MIPLHLHLAGFLSYRDPAEIDFTTFDLACISGQNGAGKSSLLDAIVWVLFGQARKRDDSLVNLQSRAAEVILTFAYEDAVYRVIRSLPRGKTTSLEFQVATERPNRGKLDNLEWRPLTERTARETQARIEQVLRLDYETFINASFFLQGRADQFTQQTASKRKDLLRNILGLEVWDRYQERTADRRKALETELGDKDGRLDEIEAELAEEQPRKERLAELEAELRRLGVIRRTQELAVEQIKKSTASLDQQRRLVETLYAALGRARTQLAGLNDRLEQREAARTLESGILLRAAKIESAYQTWQASRRQLQEWDQLALQFREQEKERSPLVEQISAGRASLEQEQRGLLVEQEAISDQGSAIAELKAEIQRSQSLLAQASGELAERAGLESGRNTARERQAEIKIENEGLRTEMDEFKSRLKRLETADGATCPLCGQPLSREHRASTIQQLETDGKQKGDRFRGNKAESDKLANQIEHLEDRLKELAGVDREFLSHSTTVAQLTERMERLQTLGRDWEKTGRKRLTEIARSLEKETYAVEAHKQLARLDKQLARLGYDAAAHDSARKLERDQREAENDFRNLETARAALKPVENEIQALKKDIEQREREAAGQDKEYQAARVSLEAALAQTPDLEEAERTLYDLQEGENRLNQEVGAARQKVSVLEQQRARKDDLLSGRESLLRQIARHRTLERAFGKDGVPALLIEQALPQIETRANELLDRLSDGQMSIRFVTQAGYKDKKREDLRETLEIQISDPAGVRDYELYSGGEAFRVNFAIRLALSEVLSQRRGARLQTLVIDEGFGSQDSQGRQRLIEAINLVRHDFAKILVITHLDELKDAFPTRIEVQKTDRGSSVTLI